MRKGIVWILVCLFVLASFGACGDGGGGSTHNTTYSVSGTITANSSGLDGVTVTLNTSSSVTTDISGNYSFSDLSDGNYTITPSKFGYTFTPTSKSVTVTSGNISGQDFAGNPRSYTFEKLAGPTIWTYLQRTIAVDSLDQVYVTSGSTIFRVNVSGETMYLNAATIAAAIGAGTDPSSLDIQSIDVGPDDRLYILERQYRKILVSNGLGSITVHRDLSGIPGFPQLIGVIDYDNILLINLYDGLWFVKGSGSSLLYDDSLVLGGTNCGTEDFAVGFDGNFAYLPGCNGSPMVGGKADGTGVGILLTTSIDVGLSNFWNFSGIGLNPAGGYIANIDGARIVNVTGAGQYELVHTQPELDVLAQTMEGNDSAFYYSPIAVGATGNIYVISSTTLYVAK